MFVGELALVNSLKLMRDCDLFVEVGRFEFVLVARRFHRLEVDPVGFVFHEVEVSQ